MESLESLNKFLSAILNFSWVDNISLVARFPPDVDGDIKKAKPKWRYLRYSNTALASVRLKDLTDSMGKDIMIKEIRITTYPGSLRVSHEDYVQKQLTTKKVLGWEIDIMPRKQIKPINSQIVIINRQEVKRFGDPQFTKSVLTEALKVKINDFNIKRPAAKVTTDIPLVVQAVIRRDRLQAQQQIRRGIEQSLRDDQIQRLSRI